MKRVQVSTTVDQERAILVASPYEDYPDVAWVAPDPPALAYDADVPVDVVRMAKQRRMRHSQERPPS